MINKTLTVLLIEDSQAYAELVHKWLTPTADIAFALHWADSLHQGLESLSQKAPDVILLDLGLPDSDGSETFQTVVGQFNLTQYLPDGQNLLSKDTDHRTELGR